MPRSNPFPSMILAAFFAFLLVYIVSLCVARSEDHFAHCGGPSRTESQHATPVASRSLEAVRVAFLEHAYCPPRTTAR
jgi:hypothetical protein